MICIIDRYVESVFLLLEIISTLSVFMLTRRIGDATVTT